MLKRRILLVDDLPDVRATLSGDLADEGYSVLAAGSREEARTLLATERFHLALLDVRLKEDDSENREGLCLACEIKRRFPTVAVIILTGHADVEMVSVALQPDQSGQAKAYKFYEKSPDTFDRIPQYVNEAFVSQVRIADTLEIQEQAEFIPLLCARMRFPRPSAPPPEQLAEEAEELVRKLFYGRTRVEPELILSGYSGVAICKFTPSYPSRGRGETVIAKLGEARLIEGEVAKYRQHVQGMAGGHRVPNVLETARTHSLAGVIYTIAGLGASQDFASFYQQANPSQLEQTLRSLFLDTCFPSRLESGHTSHALDLCSTYIELLSLHPDKTAELLGQDDGQTSSIQKGRRRAMDPAGRRD